MLHFITLRICEICHSIAQNVVGPIETESVQQIREVSAIPTNAASVPVSSRSDSRAFLIGHRFVNILLACIVFAFFLSWLFHFHMPSWNATEEFCFDEKRNHREQQYFGHYLEHIHSSRSFLIHVKPEGARIFISCEKFSNNQSVFLIMIQTSK